MQKIHIKFIAVVLIFSIFLAASPTPARADAWGSNMMAAMWKQTMEKIQKRIEQTILANLRIAAIRIIQGRLMTLLTGRSNAMGMGRTPGTNGMVISNWRQFVYGSAQQFTMLPCAPAALP